MEGASFPAMLTFFRWEDSYRVGPYLISRIVKGSLAEKLPIYEQHRRVIESLRNSGVNYNRCVVVESIRITA